MHCGKSESLSLLKVVNEKNMILVWNTVREKGGAKWLAEAWPPTIEDVSTVERLRTQLAKGADVASSDNEQLYLKETLGLLLEFHSLLLHSVQFLENKIYRLVVTAFTQVLDRLQTICTLYAKRDVLSELFFQSGVVKYKEVVDNFYLCFFYVISGKETMAKFESDETFSKRVSKAMFDHLTDPQLGIQTSMNIWMSMKLLGNCSTFVKFMATYFHQEFEKAAGGFFSGTTSKKGKKKNWEQVVEYIFELLCQSIMGKRTRDTQTEDFWKYLLEVDRNSLSLLIDEPKKNRLFRLVVEYVVKNECFEVKYHFLEPILEFINKYMLKVLQDGNKKSTLKDKTVKSFFIQVYRLVFSHDKPFALESQAAYAQLETREDYFNAVYREGQFYSIASELFVQDAKASKSRVKNLIIEKKYKEYVKERKLHCKSVEDGLLVSEYYSPRHREELAELAGYLQLIFVDRVNHHIQTGIKLLFIFSTREENEFLRYSFFEFFLHFYPLLSYQFFSKSSAMNYQKLVELRSNDSDLNIRICTVKLMALLIVDDLNALFVSCKDSLLGNVIYRLAEKNELMKIAAGESLLHVLSTIPSINLTNLPAERTELIIGYICKAQKTENQNLSKLVESLSVKLLFPEFLKKPAVAKNKKPVKRASSSKIKDVPEEIDLTLRIIQLLTSKYRESLDSEGGPKTFDKIIRKAMRSHFQDQDGDKERSTLEQLLLDRECLQEEESLLVYRYYYLKTIRENKGLVDLLKSFYSVRRIRSEMAGREERHYRLRIKILSEVIPKVYKGRDSLGKAELEELRAHLEEFIETIWDVEQADLKHVCKLMVVLSVSLDMNELLTKLLMKSITFIAVLKESILGPEKGRKRGALDVENSGAVYPLRISLASIYNIIRCCSQKLEEQAVGLLADLCLSFLSIHDQGLLQECFFLLFILCKKETDKTRNKFDLLDVVQKALESTKHADFGAFCLSVTIFEEMDREEKTKESQTEHLYNETLKLWRVNSARLFDRVKHADAEDEQTLLLVIKVLHRVSLEKEIQIRNSFVSIFGLITSRHYSVRVAARESLKELVGFECRLLTENLQYQILETLTVGSQLMNLTRDHLLDVIWSFEKSNNISEEKDAYLTTYLHNYLTQQDSVTVNQESALFKPEYQSPSEVEALESIFEMNLLLTFFYNPIHDVQRLCGVLSVYYRYVDNHLFTVVNKGSAITFNELRKLFQCVKLWTLVVFAIKTILKTLEVKQEKEIGSSLFSYAIETLGNLYSGKKKKHIEFKFTSVRDKLQEFDIYNKYVLENWARMPKGKKVAIDEILHYQEVQKVQEAMCLTVNENIEGTKADWKSNLKSKRKVAGNAAKRQKGRKRRKSWEMSESEEGSEEDDGRDARKQPKPVLQAPERRQYTMQLRNKRMD
jgi:hypothetical protein